MKQVLFLIQMKYGGFLPVRLYQYLFADREYYEQSYDRTVFPKPKSHSWYRLLMGIPIIRGL